MAKEFKRSRDNMPIEKKEFEEKVLQVDRVSRTVKGGKRIRFRAIVIIGNRLGKVGMGIGKGNEVAIAVSKATQRAKKELIEVPIVNETIPFRIDIKNGSSHIILKPARKGSSIVAGGTIRTIADLAGIKNISAKILGTANKINNSKTTFIALKKLKSDWSRKCN